MNRYQVTYPRPGDVVTGTISPEVEVCPAWAAAAVSWQVAAPDYGLRPAELAPLSATAWVTGWDTTRSLRDPSAARDENYAAWLRPLFTFPDGSQVIGGYVQVFVMNYPAGQVGPQTEQSSWASNMDGTIADYYRSFTGTWGTLNNPNGAPPAVLATSAGKRIVRVTMNNDHTTSDFPNNNPNPRWQVEGPVIKRGAHAFVGTMLRVPSTFPKATTKHISALQIMSPTGQDYSSALRFMFHTRTQAGEVGLDEMLPDHWHVQPDDRGPGEPGLAFTQQIIRSQWLKVVLEMQAESDPRAGWLRMWTGQLGQPLVPNEWFGIPGLTTLPCAMVAKGAAGLQFENHLYRGAGNYPGDLSVDFGRMAYGPTLASVDPEIG